MQKTNTLFQIDGIGGDEKLTEEELSEIKNQAKNINVDIATNLGDRRRLNEETRLCIWDGQSLDGLKHQEAMQDGLKPFPFEGASDSRVRLADMIVNERVIVLALAALRMEAKVKGTEIIDEGYAGHIQTLLHWLLNTHMGTEYLHAIVRVAQYQEGDSPGVGVLGVWWDQHQCLKYQNLNQEQLLAALVQFGVSQQEAVDLVSTIIDGDPKEAVSLLLGVWPNMKSERASIVVKELRESGQARIPMPYVKSQGPKICAYRLYEDIFFHYNTTDAQRVRVYFLREWLTEVELLERVNTREYDEDFVDQVLQHEGQSVFPDVYVSPNISELNPMPSQTNPDNHKGHYEVITAIYRAVNDENVPGIYMATFSDFADTAARPRTLLDYAHGEYPLHIFSREILGNRLLDSRGIPELVMTDQQAEKFLIDSFKDSAALGTLPPIRVPRHRRKLQLVIGPLSQIPEERPGEINWMHPPAYPAANEKIQEIMRWRVDNYFGRMSDMVPPALNQMHWQFMVHLFLATLKGALEQMLQLCQQYMPDSMLQRVTGSDGMRFAKEVSEIQGQFDVTLSFDPGDLNMDYLKELMELVAKYILPLDTLSTVQRDVLVQRLLSAINPRLAEVAWRPAKQARESEIDDEESNFVKISAGIEPPMQAEGQDFGTRLAVLEGIGQRNPEAIRSMSPVSRQMYQARLEHLANQVQQQRNAIIGQRVGQTVLGG